MNDQTELTRLKAEADAAREAWEAAQVAADAALEAAWVVARAARKAATTGGAL